ncbi:radical SAM protein [Candidatus Woesearchaeota archaeon]|nr:radical SAM protein [Candidatus Woesearchaeota archaeon]
MPQIDVLYIHPLGKNPAFSRKYFKKAGKTAAEHCFGFIPMGIIGVINNLIKHGLKVRGISLPLKKRINPSFSLEECLKFYNPKVILIDMHWYVQIKNGLETARQCKKIHGCKIIIGGMSATLFYEELLKISYIDYVLKGDAEKPLAELCSAILGNKPKNKIQNIASGNFDNEITYSCTDIDNYDYVNMGFLEDSEAYISMFDFWLMVGKGCPFNCEHCDGSHHKTKALFGRNSTIFRSPENVVKDLKSISAETVNFSLDLSLMPDELIERLSKEKFNSNLRNEFFHTADLCKLRKLKGSFPSFDFVFSPIAGNEDVRKKYGKPFSNKQFLDCLRRIEEEDYNGGIIVYFTDYVIYPEKAVKLDENARNEFIRKILEIVPYALVKVLPQVADPGTLKGRIPIKRLFRLYSA